MDSALIPRGVKRCPFPQFILFIGSRALTRPI